MTTAALPLFARPQTAQQARDLLIRLGCHEYLRDSESPLFSAAAFADDLERYRELLAAILTAASAELVLYSPPNVAEGG